MQAFDHDPLSWLDDELDRWERAGLRRHLVERSGAQAAQIVINGKTLINFGSNDYLGLADDPRLATAARLAAEREGWGSGASPLISGRSAVHAELERRLADFEGTEAALVFPSGFAANAGVIPALVDEPDAIFADAKNHASLIDGCRLCRARRLIYPHCDCDALEGLLHSAEGARRRLIVTDTLFSMDGDLAPVARLAELADRYGAMVLVDEAHATGVFGRTGRGVLEWAEVREHENDREKVPDPFLRMGTLSKALGSGGGFICGSQKLIDWLANKARTYVFSTAQPAATSAAAIAAIEIVRNEPERRERLLATATEFRERLRAQGWNTGRSSSQIIPLYVGDADRATELSRRLREAGFFVPGIRPPTVPEGESLLRLSLSVDHTPAMLDDVLAALQRAAF